MDDFTIILQDAVRMKRAIEGLAKGNKSEQIKQRVGALAIMLIHAKSVRQLELTCEGQRGLLRTLLKLKEETESEPVSDLAQGFWRTSVRHSPQTGDGGGDVDSRGLGAQSLPVLAPTAEPSGTAGSNGPSDPNGLAGPLPRRKHHRKSKRKDDIQYRSIIKRIDSEGA